MSVRFLCDKRMEEMEKGLNLGRCVSDVSSWVVEGLHTGDSISD